jgi:hypothetical protein
MGTIRTEQTRLLQDNGTENIEFFVYDKDGVAKSTLNQSKDVLKQIPSNLSPINSNLSVEYLRPLRDAIKTTNTQDVQLINKNPNFRYNSFNWDINTVNNDVMAHVGIPSQILPNVNPITGIYCLIQNGVPPAYSVGTPQEKTNYMIKNILFDSPIISGQPVIISYNYQVNTQFITGAFINNVLQYISVGLDSTGNGTINKMYNFSEGAFETGTFTDDKFFKKIDYTQFNTWNKFSTSINCDLTEDETNPHIEVKLFKTTQGQSLFQPTMLYDGLSLLQKTGAKDRIHKKRKGVLFTTINELNQNKNESGEYKQKETLLSNELEFTNINSILGTFKHKDRPLSTQKTLDKCVLQEFINDYRTPVKRYEGEFYKDDADEVPIYFYNKLWINFGTTILQEPVSCIIDSLEYNVKQNHYNIIMHVPNADNNEISYDTYKLD